MLLRSSLERVYQNSQFHLSDLDIATIQCCHACWLQPLSPKTAAVTMRLAFLMSCLEAASLRPYSRTT